MIINNSNFYNNSITSLPFSLGLSFVCYFVHFYGLNNIFLFILTFFNDVFIIFFWFLSYIVQDNISFIFGTIYMFLGKLLWKRVFIKYQGKLSKKLDIFNYVGWRAFIKNIILLIIILVVGRLWNYSYSYWLREENLWDLFCMIYIFFFYCLLDIFSAIYLLSLFRNVLRKFIKNFLYNYDIIIIKKFFSLASLYSTLSIINFFCLSIIEIFGPIHIISFIMTLLSSNSILFNDFHIKWKDKFLHHLNDNEKYNLTLNWLCDKFKTTPDYILYNFNLNANNVRVLMEFLDIEFVHSRRPVNYTFHFPNRSGKSTYAIPENLIKYTIPHNYDSPIFLFKKTGPYSSLEDAVSHVEGGDRNSVFIFDKETKYLFTCNARLESSIRSNEILFVKHFSKHVPYDPALRNIGNKDIYIKDNFGVYHSLDGCKTVNPHMGDFLIGPLEALHLIKYAKPNAGGSFCTNSRIADIATLNSFFNPVNPTWLTGIKGNRFK